MSLYFINYRRTGFKCETLIIANCEFSPDSQSLERKQLLLPVPRVPDARLSQLLETQSAYFPSNANIKLRN